MPALAIVWLQEVRDGKGLSKVHSRKKSLEQRSVSPAHFVEAEAVRENQISERSWTERFPANLFALFVPGLLFVRSEERRVGKECRL